MALNPTHSAISGSIVESAILLHRDLGPGLFESTYETLLADELTRRGHAVNQQHVLPVLYRGRRIEQAFRVDLLVDHVVVLEIKCTERNSPLYRRQLLTYLRMMRLEVGLVLNFGLATMKEGIDRVINRHMIP